MFDFAHNGSVTGGVFGVGRHGRVLDVFARLERRTAAKHRVKDYAQRPKIAGLVVGVDGAGHGNAEASGRQVAPRRRHSGCTGIHSIVNTWTE